MRKWIKIGNRRIKVRPWVQGPRGKKGVKGDTGDQGLQGLAGTAGANGSAGDTRVKYCKRNLASNSSGVFTVTLPQANLSILVSPRTAGAYVSSVVQTGTSLTINFGKLNLTGLGLTLGTLLTATILAPSVGVINFDLIACEETP